MRTRKRTGKVWRVPTGNKRMGERIRSQRLARGLSQAQLADRVGYANQSLIAKIESGEMGVSTDKLEQISAVLELEIGYLVHGPRGNMARELAELSEDFATALKRRGWRAISKLSRDERQQLIEDFTAMVEARAKTAGHKKPKNRRSPPPRP